MFRLYSEVLALQVLNFNRFSFKVELLAFISFFSKLFEFLGHAHARVSSVCPDDQDSCNPDTALEKSVLNLREMQHRVHQMLSRQGNRQLASGETKLGEIPIQLHNGSPSLIHISALDRAKSADSTHEADGVHTQPLKGGTVQYLRDLPNNLAFRNYIGKDAVGTSGSKAKFLQECVDQYERRQANARAKKAAQEKLDDEEWNIEREAAGRKRLYAMVKALSDADATDHGWALLSHSYPFLHPASHQPPKTQEQRRHFGISMRSASYHALVTSNRTAEQDPQLPQKASSSAYRPGERRTKIHGSEHHCPLEREDGSVDYWQHQIVEFDKHSRAIEEYTSNILGEFDTRKKALESKLLESKVIESKLLESKLLGSKVLESAVASQVRAAKPPMLRKPSKSLEKATVLLHRQGTKDQQLVQVSQDSVDKAGKETAGLNTYAPDNNKPAVKPVGRTHTKPDWKQCPSAGITGAEILEQLTREDIHRSMTYNGQVVKADRKALRTRFKGVLQPRDLPTTPLEQSQARSQAKGAPQMIEKVQGHPAIARLPSFDSGSKVAGKQPSTITSASGGAHRKNSNRTRYSRKALPTIRSPKLHVDGAVVESLVWQPTYREVSRFDLDKFEKAACAQVLDKKLKKRSASTSQVSLGFQHDMF